MHDSCTGSNVIPKQRDENCLFCVVSYCMYKTKDRHIEVRLSTANKIINK